MTETATFSTAKDIFVGSSILGGAMQGDPLSIASILCGEADRSIGMVTFFKLNGRYAESEEDLVSPVITQKIKQIKFYFEFLMGNAMRGDPHENSYEKERAAKAKAKADLEKLAARLRQSNKPHPMGTVDELAKKFGVSKSEVRRRKSDGTLGELLMNMKSPS